MSDRPIREYRAILTVDIEDYSSRTDAEQRDLQSALMTALDHAADAAELNREQWVRQLGGDGLTALLPSDTPIEDLLDVFVRRLDADLGSYNRFREQATWSRIRLRLAVHAGPVHVDGSSGWPGQHAVLPARLRDSAPVRAALAARPDADLAVIVSAEVYGDYITQGPGNPRPSEFRAVRFEAKEKSFLGYLYLPRFAVHEITELSRFDVADQTRPGDKAPEAERPRSRRPAASGGIIAGRDVIGKVSNRVRGGDLNYGGGAER